MEIGLDLNGVVNDPMPLKVWWARELFGMEIPPERFKRRFVVGEYLTDEQYTEVQKHIFSAKGDIPVFNPVPGASEYIRRLQEEGHSLRLITSRGDNELDNMTSEIEAYGFGLDIITVGYRGNKADACRGLDIYVDDDIEKLKPLVGIVPYRFMFRWKHNEDAEVNPSIAKSVWSWQELYKEISEIGAIKGC